MNITDLIYISKSEKYVKLIFKLAAVIFFTFLTALSSQIKIHLPFTSVPFTLQTAAIFVSVAFLGRYSLLSMIIYLVGGFAGVNWYAFSMSYAFSGPTFGYIAGFVFGAYAGGIIFEKLSFRDVKDHIILFVSVELPVYVCGILWLKFYTGFDFYRLLFLGFFPFIIWDILKYIAVIPVLNYVKKKSLTVF